MKTSKTIFTCHGGPFAGQKILLSLSLYNKRTEILQMFSWRGYYQYAGATIVEWVQL